MSDINQTRERRRSVLGRNRFVGRPWTTLIISGLILLITGIITAFTVSDPDNAAAGYALSASLTGAAMAGAGGQWALESARSSQVMVRFRARWIDDSSKKRR